MAEDPIQEFQQLFRRAQRTGMALPESMALATADRQGRPRVRVVLLKQVDEQGFVFFGDSRSRKGRDLAENPRAAAVFYWHPTGKQVRVEGRVERVTAEEADRYWVTRPRQSRLAASVSKQSAPIANREALLAAWEKLRKSSQGQLLPRPGHWIGYRLIPEVIEFWTRRSHRLHERALFTRTRNGWKRTLLQP